MAGIWGGEKQSGGELGSQIWDAGMNGAEEAGDICLDLIFWRCKGPGWPLRKIVS